MRPLRARYGSLAIDLEVVGSKRVADAGGILQHKHCEG